MVKLTSARQSRMYGPPGSRDLCENLNAFLYLFGTILLAAGVLLLLPSFHVHNTGLWLILIGLVIIVLVNLHDLYAHLDGIDYNFSLLSLDPQLWLIELAAPLVQSIGGILLGIATLFLLRAHRGGHNQHQIHTAFILLTVGSALWLLGAIHNVFQVYEKASLRVQLLQKAVSLPFLVASELLVLSGVLTLQASGHGRVAHKLTTIATWLALVASGLLVLGAVLNAIRVRALQAAVRYGSHLETLRGGAEERLQSSRAHSEPLLSSKGRDIESDQTNASYRSAVIPAESLSR